MPVEPVTRALVLRQVDYGEADRIVSLLTADRGRVETRIPQARRSRKRFGGLDLFVLAEVRFSPRKGAPRLEEARPLRSFTHIRDDLERLALAAYAAELLLQASAEDHHSPDLYRLALAAMESLDREPGEPTGGHGWARGFELKLLHVQGSRPSLRRCAASGVVPDPPIYWSVLCGGVLSAAMREEDPLARPIAADVVGRLDQALHTPLAEQTGLDWSDRQAREARAAMRDFVGEHVGGRDKALRFLEQLLPLTLLLLALVGCQPWEPPSQVRLQGYLFNTPDPTNLDGETDLAFAVPGAVGDAWNDVGERVADSSNPYSDHPSWHRVEGLPPTAGIHLVFQPPEEPVDEVAYVTTVLSGRTAAADLFVDPGVLHIWSRADVDNWTNGWFDAVAEPDAVRPTFDVAVPDEGGVAVGQVADAAGYLGLRLLFRDLDGQEVEAWYTDDDGLPIKGDGLSADGGFAVFGLAPGPVQVHLVDDDGAARAGTFLTRFEEDGITSLFGFAVQ